VSQPHLQKKPTLSERATLLGRVGWWLIVLLLAGTFAVELAVPVVSWQWTRQPFPGLLFEQTMVISGISNLDWGVEVPPNPTVRLTAINGQRVDTGRELVQTLRSMSLGDPVDLTLQHRDGSAPSQVQTLLQSFPIGDWVIIFWMPYIVGLVYLGIGVWVFRHRGDQRPGQSFAICCALVALSTGTIFDLNSTYLFSRVWTAAIPFTAAALLHLALVFPEEGPLTRRFPWFRFLPYLIALIPAVVGQMRLYDTADPWAYITPWRWGYAAIGVAILGFFGLMLYARARTLSAVVRQQVRIILVGGLLAFAPVTVYMVLAGVGIEIGFQPALYLPPLIIFPCFIGYAILRYKLLGMDLVVGRRLAYRILIASVVGSYFLVLVVPGRTLGIDLMNTNPLLLAFLVVILVFVFNPLRRAAENLTDRLLGRQRHDYRAALQAFSRELVTTPLERQAILNRLLDHVGPASHSAPALVFLYDRQHDRYILQQSSGFVSPEGLDLSFGPEDGLVQALSGHVQALYLQGDETQLPAHRFSIEERHKLEAMGLVLFFPLRGQEHLDGFLALGPRLSGEPYSPDDVAFLAALVDQTAIAIENAQLFADLEQRVLQMDALRKISEAVDLRRRLEDLFDLIYEQTSRVMEVDNLYVALYDETRQELRFAYYVEERERRQPQETAWPLGRGLTSQIVHQRQPIVTDDYLAECARRGVTSSGKPAQAWLGVPLLAGNRVLGVLNVSSFRPRYRYTPAQVQLVSAIADQAALALDRMWVYQEMQAKAAELATLNEVIQTINSTLDLPSVLDLIMSKVVELLDVEAGSLLLLDEASGDLIFEVALGAPSSQGLVGRHHAADEGIAGHVMKNGQALIVNDVQNDPRWNRQIDQDIEFVTHSILCVPMISRELVIGVIEVLNHRGGKPFDETEADLLTGFAAQAAVAIENARLYTQTDQALAQRVEELSTMQHIDRELNATLDFDRVMDMTLDWALKGTGAPVGVITQCDESRQGMLLLAMRGYLPDYERYREELWPLDAGIVSRVIRSGEPALVQDVTEDPDYHPAQPATRSQLTVPIRREQRVIGVVNVESPDVGAFDEDDLAFLQRLADHAAIAIENAILYRGSERRAEDMTLLYDISLTVSSHLALDEVLEEVYERVREVWDPPVFFVALYDEAQNALDFPIYVDRGGRLEPFRQELDQHSGFSAWIVGNQQPILIHDWQEEAATSPVQGIAVGDVTRSWLGVPLIAGERMVGVISVQDYVPNAYGQEHLQFLSTIAAEVSIAIENARLYQQSEQYARELAARAERLALVNRISTAVNSTLDLDEMLQTATRETARAFQVKQAGIILFEQEAGYGRLAAEYREIPESTPAEVHIPLADNPSLERVITTQRPLAIHDIHHDPLTAGIRGTLKARGVESILIVPLVVKGITIGTIGLDAIGEPRIFTPVEIDLAQTIANQVGLAVENVRLYQETQQRLKEVTLLFDSSTAVSRTLELEKVLHTTAEQITTALAADGCAISLWDREQDALVTLLDYSADPDWWKSEAAGAVYALADYPVSRRVLVERAPLVVQASDPGSDATEMGWMTGQEVRSLLMVPMVARDEAVGLLELMQTEDEREFTPTEIRLCQTLANQAAAALENARLYEGVKEADRAKSEFIDFVAHELKQPMTAMQGYARMLTMGIGGELTDMQNQFVEVITSNVDRMGKLVNDLLEISRLEAGRIKLALAPVSLKEVVEETLTNTRTEIEARQHSLEIDLPEDLPPVLGDPDRLIQILTNLVSNAYKYTPAGGTIRIVVNGRDEAGMPAEVPAGHLLVSVSDTGIGMSSQELARLEEKFFRADQDLVRSQPGTGLGVSITRNLVELHGGEFLVESEVDKGSTFSFTVPVAKSEEGETAFGD
jgi:GAF domain-containing protein